MQQIRNCNYALASHILLLCINLHCFILVVMDVSGQATRNTHSISKVQWSSNYSLTMCEQSQTSHSPLSVCLRVACEVVC